MSFCPYRICPIGAHSDHNLGKITGLAIDKGIHIAWSPKQNGVVEMSSLQFSKRAQWHVASVPTQKQQDWADYLRGATWALSKKYRLSAVKDIQFAVDALKLDDDLLVMAGDNLLDFSLEGFIRYAREKQVTCVMRYYEAEEARLHKTGVAQLDAQDRILSMEEKPAHPKSHWCIPAFYYYRREDVRLIRKAIEGGCGTDAPGSFIAWLCGQTEVFAWEMPGRRYDIGNLQSYEEVKKTFGGICA